MRQLGEELSEPSDSGNNREKRARASFAMRAPAQLSLTRAGGAASPDGARQGSGFGKELGPSASVGMMEGGIVRRIGQSRRTDVPHPRQRRGLSRRGEARKEPGFFASL
jgi:hypothetical protein